MPPTDENTDPIVIVTVSLPGPNDFKALFGPLLSQPASGCSTATFNLPFPSPLVTVDGITGPLVKVDGNKITVCGKVNLQFMFIDLGEVGPAFNPVGISFYLKDDGNKAGLQLSVASLPREDIRFGIRQYPPNGPLFPFVQLHDTWTQKGTPGAVDFAYYLVIQDAWGNIGVIDPDIENDSDP